MIDIMAVASSDTRATLSTRLVVPFLRAAVRAGVSLDDDLPELKLDRTDLTDPDVRVPHRLAIDLLEFAIERTGDEALGLHAAELVEPGQFDVSEYAALSSETLGECIERSGRYLRLLHDRLNTWLVVEGERASQGCDMPPPLRFPPAAVDFFLAVMVLMGRRISPGWNPLQVRFAYPEPSDTAEHVRVFQSTLRFGATDSCLVFSAERLAAPMPKADARLCTILDRHAEQLLEQLPAADRLVDQVRQLVLSELRGGEPTNQRIARKLALSTRTLRRRLQEEGTTFKQILEELRRDMALRYLSERQLSPGEVAYLLGFSTPSAFHKAFKRWTGVTPAQARQQIHVS